MLNSKRQRQSGTAAVEAALTLLAFFAVILGVVEAGRVINIQQTLTDAAREGARLAVAPASGTSNLPSNSEIANHVNTFLGAAHIQGATIQVDPVIAVSGDLMTSVTVIVPYRVITISMFTNLEIPLRGTSVMRNETSP